VALGVVVALGVLVLAGAALEVARLRLRADLPPIDPGLGIPIAVKPLLDAPQARRGRSAHRRTAVVPQSWARAPRRPSPDVSASMQSPTPGERSESALQPPSDPSSLPSIDDPDEDATGDTGTGDPQEPGPGETGDTDAGGTGGDPEGDPEGELAANAVALYRDRLSRWLSARFRVSGSGLSREELRRTRARAVLRIGIDGTVVGYEVIPSGNAAFDEGARAALESVRGEPVPTPPDHYPGALQSEIKVTFVCKESQCD
jgi:hypothetical protein